MAKTLYAAWAMIAGQAERLAAATQPNARPPAAIVHPFAADQPR